MPALPRARRAAPLVLAATALGTVLGGHAATPAAADPRGGSVLGSGITDVQTLSTTPLTLAGGDWVRTTGVVRGVVDPDEQVAGLAALPRDAEGRYAYSSEFEVIAPARARGPQVALVETENRGAPLVLGALQGFSPGTVTPTGAAYPAGLGNGFLFSQGIAYARVQWQTGIAAGVPATAQGVGEVITRDFGRLLGSGDGRRPEGARDLPRFSDLLLAGVSQSAWFVNTFVAEGFNADPRTRGPVYDAALAVDGTGNRLAINQLAGSAPQTPYVLQDGVPLTTQQLLTRPGSDPVYVDIANYTDYYRTRASVSAQGALPAYARRYDFPSPHAGPSYPDSVVFGLLRCNAGVVVPLNPVDYRPYLRTVVAQLADRVEPGRGARRVLPPSALFDLLPAETAARSPFNPLPGVPLQVPATDPDTAQPVGGVRFAETVLPLGRPLPVALTPVSTTAITDVCGNWGGWQRFSSAELQARYGSVDAYVARYAVELDRLVAERRLLASEVPGQLEAARTRYLAAPAA